MLKINITVDRMSNVFVYNVCSLHMFVTCTCMNSILILSNHTFCKKIKVDFDLTKNHFVHVQCALLTVVTLSVTSKLYMY